MAQEEVGPAFLRPEWIFNSESFTEDYVLLLFLPMDSNMDKAELEAFSVELDQLASLDCQVGN